MTSGLWGRRATELLHPASWTTGSRTRIYGATSRRSAIELWTTWAAADEHVGNGRSGAIERSRRDVPPVGVEPTTTRFRGPVLYPLSYEGGVTNRRR